jgi:lantibiotic modifying enzyme
MSIPTDTDDPFAMDLVSGLAGTVLSMTVASAVLDQDHELLARAGTAAEFLVSCGERGPDGSLSWKTMRDCSSNLTGFAHGTSGIAHALLALAATAREGDFRKAAADAIAYESSVFDPVRRLWPDFRSLPEYFEGEPAFGVGWCHGAAGIVRGRITAAASNIKVDSDLDAGITAIVEQARRWSQFPSVDLTLCHGLLGLVDTLLECSRFNYGNYDELVAEVVAPIVDQFHDGLPWPTGLPSREPAHGLMLGDAGIGHFFLRLTDPTQESVLAPGLSLVTK